MSVTAFLAPLSRRGASVHPVRKMIHHVAFRMITTRTTSSISRNRTSTTPTRRCLFTNTTTRKRSTTTDKKKDKDEDPHAMFREQMEELKLEREELFGFTQGDRDAWSSAGSSHQHQESFLARIEEAREAALEQAEIDDPNNNIHHPAHLDRATTTYDRTTTNSTDTLSRHENPQNSFRLSHVSRDSKSIHMVDVGDKATTRRSATARSIVHLPDEVLQALTTTTTITSGSNQERLLISPKGPVFETAKIAGIMAAK